MYAIPYEFFHVFIVNHFVCMPAIHHLMYSTVEPLNKGHFGDNINSADLFFVERLSSLGGSKCIVGIILGL